MSFVNSPVIIKPYHLFVATNLAKHHKFKTKVSVLSTVERIIQMFPEYRDSALRHRLTFQLNQIYQELI
jgi:hypothetical protein